VRGLALLLVAALALAACGGGKKKAAGPGSDAQIRSAYSKFFSSKTSLSDRVALLQNGSRFKPVIQSFASNPLAQNVSATVSSVALHGSNNATVVFVVKLGGSPLPKQTGTAVRQNGTWKVGSETLCRLVELGGTAPPQCTK
jgi:hypothetical protein